LQAPDLSRGPLAIFAGTMSPVREKVHKPSVSTSLHSLPGAGTFSLPSLGKPYIKEKSFDLIYN
jgi:hypothetical protein